MQDEIVIEATIDAGAPVYCESDIRLSIAGVAIGAAETYLMDLGLNERLHVGSTMAGRRDRQGFLGHLRKRCKRPRGRGEGRRTDRCTSGLHDR